MLPKIERLAELAGERGVPVTFGYVTKEGRRVNEDSVITLYREADDPLTSTAFEEDEDGVLWVLDPVTPEAALEMVWWS